jgi:hypothetical protein
MTCFWSWFDAEMQTPLQMLQNWLRSLDSEDEEISVKIEIVECSLEFAREKSSEVSARIWSGIHARNMLLSEYRVGQDKATRDELDMRMRQLKVPIDKASKQDDLLREEQIKFLSEVTLLENKKSNLFFERRKLLERQSILLKESNPNSLSGDNNSFNHSKNSGITSFTQNRSLIGQ